MADFSPQHFTKAQVIEASTVYFKGEKLPATVFADKYAMRDKQGRYYELTPDDMHRRLAKEFARIEAKYPNPLSEETIYGYLKNFSKIVPQGSPMFGIGNPHQLVSLSNCSVLPSPQDTMSSILETGRDMANLYKRRFGVGIDISDLRPEGASVNNAAVTSTGAWSFADLYSYITRMVGQQGRRGALMITMDVRHPDVMKFITMKDDLSKVTGANVSVKVSDDFMQAVERDEEFVLRWPVESIPAAEALHRTHFEGDNIPASRVAKVVRTVRARDVYEKIAEMASKNAEPGVLFWDTIKRNLPLDFYPGFETISTNPCGELPLCANDSCRLISLYLPAFIVDPFGDGASFDWHAFRQAVSVGQRLSDDLVDLELEALQRLRDAADQVDEQVMFDNFIAACRNGRRTGLGTHGWGDALTMWKIRYDSEDGILVADMVYQELKLAAYQESVRMAKERGAFPMFNWETEKNCEFFKRLPDSLVDDMEVHGRRNGALLTNAPTGSVSIMSMVDGRYANGSSGIEPVFSIKSHRRNRKIDPNKESTTGATKDAQGDYWLSYEVNHPTVALWKEIKGDEPLPDYFVDTSNMDWLARVKMQAAITSHIDHSVSSTLNLPRGTGKDVVAEIYFNAWKRGCKGMTVYVDGSRDQQVLSTAPEKKEQSIKPLGEVLADYNAQPKDPALNLMHDVTNAISRANLRAQEAEQKFADLLERFKDLELKVCSDDCLTKTHRPTATKGEMFKASFTHPVTMKERKVYVYVGRNDIEPVEAFVIDQQGDEDLRPYAEALGRLTSLALKFGVPAETVVEQLRDLKGGSVSYTEGIHQSVPDLLAKQLDKMLAEKNDIIEFMESYTEPYFREENAPQLKLAVGVPPSNSAVSVPDLIPTATVVSVLPECPRCNQHTFKIEGGCSQCLNEECAYSKCA